MLPIYTTYMGRLSTAPLAKPVRSGEVVVAENGGYTTGDDVHIHVVLCKAREVTGGCRGRENQH